jgi:hypothetical protein
MCSRPKATEQPTRIRPDGGRLPTPDRAVRFLHRLQDIPAVLVIALTLLGQGEIARRAVDQAGAEMLLEHGDLLTDRRLRRAELACHGREAAGLGDAGEDADRAESIHAPFPPRMNIIRIGIILLFPA